MDLDEELDRLFRLPPELFTEARDGLGRRLRADGDRDGAGHVKRLRRPTRAAWAVNHLVRNEPGALDDLVAAGKRLSEAQRRALAGVAQADLRGAAQQRRAVLDRVADLAADALRGVGTDPAPHLAAIVATLEAASIDHGAATAVGQGRLSKELPAPSGFGELDSLALMDPSGAQVEAVRTNGEERADEEGDRELRETSAAAGEAEKAQQRANAAEESETAAAEALAAARQLRQDAEAAAERLAQQAAQARRQADDAAVRLRDAERDHERAVVNRQAAAQTRQEAQSRVDALTAR